MNDLQGDSLRPFESAMDISCGLLIIWKEISESLVVDTRVPELCRFSAEHSVVLKTSAGQSSDRLRLRLRHRGQRHAAPRRSGLFQRSEKSSSGHNSDPHADI